MTVIEVDIANWNIINQEMEKDEPKLVVVCDDEALEIPIKPNRKGKSKEENLLAIWLKQLIDTSYEDLEEEIIVEKMRSYCQCMLASVEN